MRFEFRRGDRVHAVELTELGGGHHRARWFVRPVDGDPAAPPLATDEMELHVALTPDATYSVLVGHDVHDVRVDRDGASRTVRLRDGVVALEHLDPFRATAARHGPAAGGPVAVSSPIPGRVVSLPVSVGEDVAEGQTVIVVEAMKMANELRAPHAGRVTALRAAIGDTVDAGAPLVVIGPAT